MSKALVTNTRGGHSIVGTQNGIVGEVGCIGFNLSYANVAERVSARSGINRNLSLSGRSVKVINFKQSGISLGIVNSDSGLYNGHSSNSNLAVVIKAKAVLV